MNHLLSDLKEIIYLYLPDAQLPPNISPKFWFRKAALFTGHDENQEFEKQFYNYNSRDPKVLYLRILALSNIIVPGSELFVSDIQFLQYAVKKEDRNLAVYICDRITEWDEDSFDSYLEILEDSHWIDLAIILSQKLKGETFQCAMTSYNLFAYNNCVKDVITLREVSPFSEDDYHVDLSIRLPVMSGIDVSDNLEARDVDNLVPLAIEYKQDHLIEPLSQISETDPTSLVQAWIIRDNLQKVLELVNDDLIFDFIAGTIDRTDNLEILQNIAKKINHQNLTTLLTYGLRSKYGSKVFSWIIKGKNFRSIITPEVLASKTWTDFAGVNYLISVLSKERQRSIVVQMKEFDICPRVWGYLKSQYITDRS